MKKSTRNKQKEASKINPFILTIIVGIIFLFISEWLGIIIITCALIFKALNAINAKPVLQINEQTFLRDLPIISNIAGVQHHGLTYPDFENLLKEGPEGTKLTLVRDNNNPYDQFATELHWNGKMVGYISANHSRYVAQYIDAGFKLEASILTYDENDSYYDQISIFIEKV